jgi:hypothetical protein
VHEPHFNCSHPAYTSYQSHTRNGISQIFTCTVCHKVIFDRPIDVVHHRRKEENRFEIVDHIMSYAQPGVG